MSPVNENDGSEEERSSRRRPSQDEIDKHVELERNRRGSVDSKNRESQAASPSGRCKVNFEAYKWEFRYFVPVDSLTNTDSATDWD